MEYITLKDIEALNPCKDRLENFIRYYGKRKLTRGQFMGLKNITQADKMWVAFRLMPRDSIKLAAADIAETVLIIHGSKYPNDDGPRKAIAAARSGDKTNAALTAAAYAAYDAASNAAAYAANAATYAAYAAANAATYAATDAAANAAAYAAAYAANAAANASSHTVQEKLNRKIVLKYWRG